MLKTKKVEREKNVNKKLESKYNIKKELTDPTRNRKRVNSLTLKFFSQLDPHQYTWTSKSMNPSDSVLQVNTGP